MKELELDVRFTTPAFLGDAHQSGAWRTPPFKALLRQWWRIAVAKQYEYDWRKVREAEGRLFGHAWLKNGEGKSWAMKSPIRLRLKERRSGGMRSWEQTRQTVSTSGGKQRVNAHLYLGYGPVLPQEKRAQTLKANAAIQADETNVLKIAGPTELLDSLRDALQLAHWFGGLGGRCRNGWGSLVFEQPESEGFIATPSTHALPGQVCRPVADCLNCDWPHAIGCDKSNHPLIWRTRSTYHDWQTVLAELAQIKVDLRSELRLGNPPGKLRQRHLLGYPVTGNGNQVNAWGAQARLASQLPFKVLPAGDGRLFGLIYHLPHDVPKQLREGINPSELASLRTEVWQIVHECLDDDDRLQRTE